MRDFAFENDVEEIECSWYMTKFALVTMYLPDQLFNLIGYKCKLYKILLYMIWMPKIPLILLLQKNMKTNDIVQCSRDYL